MSLAMTDNRRPGDTDRHRRQRTKNLFMFAFLLVIAAIFFALTIVRMGGHMGGAS
jgi:uncharacterized membrane protein